MEKPKTISLEELKENLLKDEEFRNCVPEMNAEYEVMRAILEARIETDMTQKELAEKSGISQANISRLENGNLNPTIKLLQKLANSMDRHIEIRFVPN